MKNVFKFLINKNGSDEIKSYTWPVPMLQNVHWQWRRVLHTILSGILFSCNVLMFDSNRDYVLSVEDDTKMLPRWQNDQIRI